MRTRGHGSSLDPEITLEQDELLKDLRLTKADVMRSLRQRGQRAIWQAARFRWLLIAAVLPLVGYALYRVFPPLTYREVGYSASPSLGTIISGDRWVGALANESRSLEFSDGSRVKLGAATAVRVLELGLRGGSVALETGTVELSVEGSRFAEYRVSVGPFHLTIPKGRVTATWSPMTLQLDLVVHEGFAVIAGCQFAEGRSVTAGKELGTHCSEP